MTFYGNAEAKAGAARARAGNHSGKAVSQALRSKGAKNRVVIAITSAGEEPAPQCPELS